ncbi:hypothetical protein AHAS_Ahas13G0240900 [Arachis hypogaea]|uniref:CCHC-type domain-containing protein n=1 Tax=Arachis hypogaea TaxID=3818 RepID=A0A445A2E7_ARAHY|nr:hypothetical protein Ahy_B03g065777 [Arachis hypogaea]
MRLPRLAIEYYEKSMLERIGNIIGRTIKVDFNTADICRGKFVRLCVELDLTAPLVSHYSINGMKYVVEYEGIHNICFSCGMVGHEKTNCPKKVQTQKAPKSNNGGTEKIQGSQNDEGEGDKARNNCEDKGKKFLEENEDEAYGPWMVVHRRKRGKKTSRNAEAASSGGNGARDNQNVQVSGSMRFDAFQMIEKENSNDERITANHHNKRNHMPNKTITQSPLKTPNPKNKQPNPRPTLDNNTKAPALASQQEITSGSSSNKPQKTNKDKNKGISAEPSNVPPTVNPSYEPNSMNPTTTNTNRIPHVPNNQNNNFILQPLSPTDPSRTMNNMTINICSQETVIPESLSMDEDVEAMENLELEPLDFSSLEPELMMEAVRKYKEGCQKEYPGEDGIMQLEGEYVSGENVEAELPREEGMMEPMV